MTFLVTRKMAPELAARVRASVRGRRVQTPHRRGVRVVAWLRFGIAAVVLSVIAGVALVRRKANDELAAVRRALVDRVQQHGVQVGPDERRRVERARTWLVEAANGSREDYVAEELREKADLSALLARPTLYVRASVEGLRAPDGVDESAAASNKDAFVLCLNEPPRTRTEASLLGRTRTAYAGGSRMRAATGHVERLYSGLVTLPLLQPAWQEQIRSSDSRLRLASLRRELDRMPFEAALRALDARQLLYVIDEPPDTPGPAELDGERPHPVRVGLIDLDENRPWFRLRRRVDPGWLSEAARAEYARGIDSCALALEVREAILSRAGPRPAPSTEQVPPGSAQRNRAR